MAVAKYFRSMPWSTRVCIAIVCFYIFAAFFAPVIAPYGETEVVGSAFDTWSSSHLLGTDNVGRDVLSRVIYGARNMLGVAVTINFLSFLLGGALGMVTALKGGWFDEVVGRIVDAAMAIPQLILALLLIAIVGNSISVLIGIIVFLDATRVVRLTRAVSMNVVSSQFIEAARMRGETTLWCIWFELLPNIRTPMLAEFGIRFCYVFLFISGLNFLGVGMQPPKADWGSMVRESSSLITFGDFTPLVPALAIAVLTISVNFIVDWLLAKTSKAHI